MNSSKADPKKKPAQTAATPKNTATAEASKPRTETPEEYASKILKMEESKYTKYIKAFQTIDDDNSGKVSKSEFREAFTRFNFGTSWSHQSMDEMFDEIDDKKTGYIDVYSFLNKLNRKANPSKNLLSLVKTIAQETSTTDTQPDEEGPDLEEEKKARFVEAWGKKVEQYNTMGPDRYVKEVLNMDATRYKKYSKAFSLMDLNGSGDISKAEFIVVLNTFSLGTNLSREEVNEIFDGIDKGNIGEINLMNFLESLTKENPNKSLLGIIKQITFKAAEIEDYKKKKMKTAKKNPAPKKIPIANIPEKFEETKTQKGTDKTPKTKTTADKTPKAKEVKPKEAPKEVKEAAKKDAPIKNIYTRRELEKAYRLINRKKKTPLKKKVFVEIVQACSLVDDDTEEEAIEDLFKNLAKGDEDELTEEAFIESLSAENPPQIQLDLLEAILSKEQEITDYNNEKEAEEKQEMYEKAFEIINYNEGEPIKKEDFEDVVKGCSLVKAPVDQEMNTLFAELDTDKDDEITLEEFLGQEGEEKVQSNVQEFVETVLEKEEEILEYKRKRAQAKRQDNIKKAYELLELDGKGLLKKDEFVDMVKECEIMDEEKQDDEIAKLFDEINKKEAEEMSKGDFIANLTSEEDNEEQTRFVELVISKEEAIDEYKRRRKQKVVEDQCRKAFLLLDFYGSQPITAADFSDIVKGCSLYKEDIAGLFKEYDLENHGEMSLEDFTSTICAEESKPHHTQFLETILAKEEEIIEYKKKKAQSDRHNSAKRAFAIIADEGADVLSKGDFEALVKDCSLMPEEGDDLSKLFSEVDHDKNGELTLDDFLATVGCHDHHHHGRFSKLLASILENEQVIIEYKRKRAQQERERKAEKVFLLLDFYDSEPIKQPDFIEIITECSLLKKDEAFIAGLFDEIDHAKTQEIPLKEFVRVVGADISHHAFTELLTATLENEQAVIEYKKRRSRKRREEQCKQAFLLLHYHDTPAIQSDDFVDVVRGCTLINENNVTADALYKELDLDKNGEMSLEDFTNTISAEDAKAHHVEFLETVLAKEEEILEYKKRKAQGERIDSCKKAFAIIVDEGADSINKEDFDDLVKGCNLLTDEADQDISDLFHEIDHDKNGQMTLDDFLATVGSRDNYHHARFSRLLTSILTNEQVIIEYKRRRAQQAREKKAEKVFILLNFYGSEPIKRENFVEIITECSVLELNKDSLSGLFDQLDKNKNGEISLKDFVSTIGADSANQNFTNLLTNSLNKEQQIEEYKLRRARKIKEEKARKVFLLINFYGSQPIKSEDFVDITRGCSLHKEDTVSVENLFKEFNLNNNERVSLEEFTSSIIAEEPKGHHLQYLDTVLANEQEIIEYKKKKTQSDRHSSCKRAFTIIADEGANSINKEDFENLFRECSILAGEADLDLGVLFNDIDHDKNGQITIEDFLATVGSHDHHHHDRYSRLLTSVFDQEQVIIEYKRRKAINARKVKAERVFLLLNFYGNAPIKRQDLVEVITECSVLTGDRDASALFNALNPQNDEVSIEGFVETIGSSHNDQSFTQLLESAIQKEQEIIEFKRRRAIKIKEEKSRRAFLLIAFYGSQPIKSDDFADIVKGCSLYTEDPNGLFQELDHDKNGEISQEGFTATVAVEDSKPHHDQFVETILSKEQEINEYKRRRALKIKEEKSRRAFLLIAFYGSQPIKSDDFIDIVKGCSLSQEDPNGLFKELDHDNNAEISQEDFTATVAVEDSKAPHDQFIETILSKEEEINEYKKKKAQSDRHSSTKRAFAIIVDDGANSINKEDFENLFRECSILADEADLDLGTLFTDIDHDKNSQITLEDFLSTVGSHDHHNHARYSRLLTSVLDQEQVIIEYKRRKAINERKAKAERVFLILNFYGNAPIKRQDLVELINECSVLTGDKNASTLFDALSSSEEVSLSEFVEAIGSNLSDQSFTQLLESAIQKEQEIVEFKRRRALKIKEEKCRRAFLLIAFYGSQPIKTDDFVDIVSGCSLYKEDVAGLFQELDHDKNGEISQEDFVSAIAVDDSKPHHNEFLETILAKEEEINEYKKKKSQSDRHSSAKRAFAILVDDGADSINKEDFEGLFKECSILADETDLDLGTLFNDIDHDKNHQITLEDFLATVGSHDHHHHARYSRLLTSVIDNEQVIIEYKRRKAINARKAKAERVFLLLNFYGNAPIKRQDFVELITECSVLTGDKNASALFDSLNPKTEEISLSEFVEAIGSNLSDQSFSQLLESAVQKEQEIIEFKRRRALKIKEEKCRRAFLIIVFYGSQPIKSDDFADIVKGCSLYTEDPNGLFVELDNDKNGEISQEDFTATVAVEDSKPHHDEFIDTILSKEEEINEYKKKKSQSDRHSSTKRAFAILVEENANSINKEDFENLFKECSILADEADLDLGTLFNDIDHDKNGQITLEDFLATVGSHDHHHHARYSRLLTSVFDNEQVIIEYKRRKALNEREAKARRVFIIICYFGSKSIRREDFIELLSECSVLGQDKESLSGLFSNLDKDKDGEISLEDFLATAGSDLSNQHFTELLDSVVEKEEQINEHKRRRARKIREEQAARAFSILNFYGNQPIKGDDFADVVQGCSLHKEENVTTNALFKELGLDNNELSLENVLSVVGAEDFKSHHIQFVETVLVNEQHILEYKNKKSQADRHSSAKRAFAIIAEEGAESVNKEEFEDLFRGCSLMADEADLDLSTLFNEIDHDKNGQVSLDDFLATVGSHDHHHHARYSRLLTSVFDNEQAISEYKRRRAQKKREEQAEKVFILINYYGRNAIKREHWIEIITECSILSQDKQHLLALFDELDTDKDGEISLEEFVSNIGSNANNQTYSELLASALDKEQEIIEHKRRRAIRIKEEKCRRAFLIISFYGSQPIKRDDFNDVVKECSLHKSDSITIEQLFTELDLDSNAELSLEEFTNAISAEDSKSHHNEFLETILANEQEIAEYKRKKAQSDRHSSAKRAFAIIVAEGADHINKEDFEELTKECSLLADEADLDIAGFFHEIDHDKNGHVNLDDFLATAGSTDAQHHHHGRYSKLIESILNNEQLIVEFKRRKARKQREAKAEKVFFLLNFAEDQSINKEDLIEIITGCSIIPGDSHSLTVLFNELDHDKNGQVSLEDFKETLGSRLDDKNLTQLLSSTLEKEGEIAAYKADRARKLKEAKCRRVFFLISFNGTHPIKHNDFVETVKECSLHRGGDSAAAVELFQEFDVESKGEVTLEGLTSRIFSEEAKPHHNEFLDTVLANEQVIAEYKKRKLQKGREDEAQRAFSLINFNGVEPIKKDEFTEIIEGCSLKSDKSQSIADLFNELDHNKDGNISQKDFVATVAAEGDKASEFRRLILEKEEEILGFKRTRARKLKEERCRRAFLLLNFHGNQPIKSHDFTDVVQGAALYKNEETAINELFRELDNDSNGELSVEDFVSTITAEEPKPQYDEFLESVLANEQRLLEYKKKKAQADRHRASEKAFGFLVDEGVTSIGKEDFEDLVRDCGLLADEGTIDLAALFNEIDHDKNGDLTLSDFLATVGSNDSNRHHYARYSKLLTSILEHEQVIVEYRRKRALKNRQGKAERAFILLNYYGNNPIKKDDLIEIISECSLLAQDKQALSGLVDQIDTNKNGEISLADFVSTVGSDSTNSSFVELLESTLSKEQEIAEHKRRRTKRIKEEKARKAFSLINFRGDEPIQSDDFIDIVRECSLHPEDSVTVSELYKELNGSSQNDLNIEDFAASISAENAKSHHTQFVETVLANEEGILEHKRKKAQGDRHRSAEKAFDILVDEGAESINREDFEDLLRGCSLYGDEAGLDISSLFNEIDHDKNGLISLNDFLATIGSNDHHHHHYARYSKLLKIIIEYQLQIIEYQRRRALKNREGKAERVFLLLDFYGNKPLKRAEFIEIITECSLLDQDKEYLFALFDSLDKNKNGEISLADFIATIGADSSNHKFNELLQSVLDNEKKIADFKTRRAHKIKKEQSQKAFLLLNPNDSEPISLKDFSDIVTGCSLYDQSVSDLFSEFDLHKRSHISIEDFASIITSQNKPHHEQFLTTILTNETAILEFKRQAKKNRQTAQSQKAFSILAEKGSNAIHKIYFLDIIKSLSLIPHEGDSALTDLFHQLDHDKNGDISSTDFVINLTADYPQPTHSQLLTSILNREEEILAYKAKKAQQEREAQSEKAFLLLNFNGSNPLIREEFEEIVKGCSLSDEDSSNLFNELDQDKNGQVSIQDFLNTTSSEDAQAKHVKLVHTTISKEQLIIEFKNNRRRQREEQCQKAFSLIDVNGQTLINKSDFIDLFKSVALLEGGSDLATNIFQELDRDGSGEINMVEFLADVSSEKADPRHRQLVESILGKEKEILEYRNERLKKDRHAVSEKAFLLLNLFGSKPLQKDHFIEIVSSCAIIEGDNQAITDLFHRLDSDKNSEVSLADFLATAGSDSGDAGNSELLDSILAKESKINAYKKKRAQRECEVQCNEAFRLLSPSGISALKKDDFIALVRACSLVKEENNNTLSQLFHELDHNKNGEISLMDFLKTINTDNASSHHIQFLRSVLAHEKEIIEYKAKKAKEQRQAEAQKAFHILAEKETQPISKAYFEYVIKECGLVAGANEASIAELFKELDQDKNGDISIADFTNSFTGEHPNAEHTQLLTSILDNEKKIADYRRRRAQKERQALSEKAFLLITLNGNDPLKRDDFVDIIKGCSLLKERPDFKITNLFEELDVNKDGNLSLDEFVKVTSKENPLPHHSQLLQTIISNEQAIAEFKRQRAKAHQLNNAKKAYTIIAEKGTEPISKAYLKEVIQSCSLLKNENDASLTTLFQELDQDKNNEISLADFTTTLTVDNVPPKQSQLLLAILAKEQEIAKFKAERARKELQVECEKAFLLLNLQGNEPIKREDFVEIVKGCSLTKEDSNQALSGLFQELDKDHNTEISLADFVGTISADNAQPRYIQFVKTIISKEQEILEFKRKKGLSKRQVQAQKAFNILLEKGSQAVNKAYFLDIVKACSLLPSAHDTIIADVFDQLDHDRNGEISLNDFVTLLSTENPQANHAQLLVSILNKEQEIQKYKIAKARREHDALTQKVFLLLSFNGSFPIKKQDFADIVRGCSLTNDTSSQAISGLFNELDTEKRGEISLQSFQEAIPAENAQSRHIQFIQTVVAKEQEILEFKKNRIRIRQEQSRKAFDLIDFEEQQNISKADFIDLFGACSILEGNSRQEAVRLFDVLDKNKSGEVSLREFMNTVNADRADPRHIQLVEAIISKESEIAEYRNKKNKSIIEPTPVVEQVIEARDEIIVVKQEPVEEVSKMAVYHTPSVEKSPLRAENVPIQTSESVANPQKQRDVTRFTRVFQLINIHGVNTLSQAQFEEALGLFAQVGCAFTFDTKRVFNDIDTDRDRRINHADFLKYVQDERNSTNSQNLVNEILNRENEIRQYLESRGKKNVVPQEEEQKSASPGIKPQAANKAKKDENERRQKVMGFIDKFMNNIKDNKAVNPAAKEELYACIQDLPDGELSRMPHMNRSARVTFLLNVMEKYTNQMKLENHDEIKLENLERVLDEERLLLRKEQERPPNNGGGLLNLLAFIPFVTNFHFMFYADR